MKPPKPLKEFIFIAVVLILIGLFDILAAVFFGNSTLDISLHDTYFLVQDSWITSVLPPFLWLITIVYIVRTAINHYKNLLQNFILLTACLALNILMLNYLKLSAAFDGLSAHALTLRSPMPNLSKIDVSKWNGSPYNNTTEIIFIIQIFLLLLLVIIAVLTGKNWKTTKNAH